jgi:hypothetical protein
MNPTFKVLPPSASDAACAGDAVMPLSLVME